MIELKNISKSFKKGDESVLVFQNTSLFLDDCGLSAITGASGSGKTTLINLLAGLDNDFSGEFFINGINAVSEYPHEQIAYVMQDDNLFENLSVYNNVNIYNEIHDNEIDKILKQLDIYNLRNKKVSKLSGGERRRVSLAKAMLKSPKILICDEPISSLDYDNSINVLNLLKELSKNILVIFSCHNEELVKKYADNIYNLENNKIVQITKNKCILNTTIKNEPLTIRKKYRFFTITNNFFNNKKNISVSIFSLSFLFLIFIILTIFLFQNFSYIQAETMKKENDYTMLVATNDPSICNIYLKDDNNFLNFFAENQENNYYYYILPINYCFYDVSNINTNEIIGDIPRNTNEIMIYQILAEDLIHYGLMDEYSTLIYYDTINELLNKKITIDNNEFVITGIIKQDLKNFQILEQDDLWLQGNRNYEKKEKLFSGKILTYSGNIITTRSTLEFLNSKYNISQNNYLRYKTKEINDYNSLKKELKRVEPQFNIKNLITNKYMFYVTGSHYSNSLTDIFYDFIIIKELSKYGIVLIILILFLFFYLFVKNIVDKNCKTFSLLKLQGFSKKQIAHSFHILVLLVILLSNLLALIFAFLFSKISCIYFSKAYYFYFNPFYINYKVILFLLLLTILLFIFAIYIINKFIKNLDTLKYLHNN